MTSFVTLTPHQQKALACTAWRLVGNTLILHPDHPGIRTAIDHLDGRATLLTRSGRIVHATKTDMGYEVADRDDWNGGQ